MSDDSIFMKIVRREIPADIVVETDDVLAFRDINPQAPHHYLVIPKRCIPSIEDLTPEDEALVGKLFLVAQQVARQQGFAEDGYRTVMNCGRDGGQDVYHIHLHVLAGRRMQWPPG
ncbi:histidine triad (HIT) family protein [Natronocella acetinitrilica]|uniref:Histidine triad (HIT) family protein n=2 Tax=Natronocella acetinitrilica TaxID=414046 RepID=A0AAE3G5W5_9GAMM|nr:histidine triad (HIT) family protein [Natronocella acetinitrilica]